MHTCSPFGPPPNGLSRPACPRRRCPASTHDEMVCTGAGWMLAVGLRLHCCQKVSPAGSTHLHARDGLQHELWELIVGQRYDCALRHDNEGEFLLDGVVLLVDLEPILAPDRHLGGRRVLRIHSVLLERYAVVLLAVVQHVARALMLQREEARPDTDPAVQVDENALVRLGPRKAKHALILVDSVITRRDFDLGQGGPDPLEHCRIHGSNRPARRDGVCLVQSYSCLLFTGSGSAGAVSAMFMRCPNCSAWAQNMSEGEPRGIQGCLTLRRGSARAERRRTYRTILLCIGQFVARRVRGVCMLEQMGLRASQASPLTRAVQTRNRDRFQSTSPAPFAYHRHVRNH